MNECMFIFIPELRFVLIFNQQMDKKVTGVTYIYIYKNTLFSCKLKSNALLLLVTWKK